MNAWCRIAYDSGLQTGLSDANASVIVNPAYNVCSIIGRTVIDIDKLTRHKDFTDYFILHIGLRFPILVIFAVSELDNLSFSEFLVDIK